MEIGMVTAANKDPSKLSCNLPPRW